MYLRKAHVHNELQKYTYLPNYKKEIFECDFLKGLNSGYILKELDLSYFSQFEDFITQRGIGLRLNRKIIR